MRIGVHDLLRCMLHTVGNMVVEDSLLCKNIQTTVTHETRPPVFSATPKQPTEIFDPHVMRCLGLGIIQQQQIHVVFAVWFRGHVFDTVAVVFGVQGDNVYTDGQVLFLEFRDVPSLHWEWIPSKFRLS